MTRRSFLAGASLSLGCSFAVAYTVEKRNGRWLFYSPSDEPLFSIGLNHIDSASLRQKASGWIWHDRFDNSQETWIREGVRPDLEAWGFNTVGWNQEVVIRGESLTEGGVLHRHSRSWTPEEYRWLDMPYCHMLPIIESHQWELESKLPDIRSAEFEEWCDYVCRTDCARMAADSNLVGYFYTDCPIWVHSRRPEYKPPIFDPEMLTSEAGKRELFDLATHYYRTIHEAVRRYDADHLILGDRYEARQPLAEEVLRAAVPYVDVLSFQDFGPIAEVVENFHRWHQVTGLPVLLADAGAKQADNQRWEPYSVKMRALAELDFCVGWHLCGAYIRNTARRRGLRNERFEPDQPFIDEVTETNRQTLEALGI